MYRRKASRTPLVEDTAYAVLPTHTALNLRHQLHENGRNYTCCSKQSVVEIGVGTREGMAS
jgi:hypothetical protein